MVESFFVDELTLPEQVPIDAILFSLAPISS
jgi:hypothetical protein